MTTLLTETSKPVQSNPESGATKLSGGSRVHRSWVALSPRQIDALEMHRFPSESDSALFGRLLRMVEKRSLADLQSEESRGWELSGKKKSYFFTVDSSQAVDDHLQLRIYRALEIPPKRPLLQSEDVFNLLRERFSAPHRIPIIDVLLLLRDHVAVNIQWNCPGKMAILELHRRGRIELHRTKGCQTCRIGKDSYSHLTLFSNEFPSISQDRLRSLLGSGIERQRLAIDLSPIRLRHRRATIAYWLSEVEFAGTGIEQGAVIDRSKLNQGEFTRRFSAALDPTKRGSLVESLKAVKIQTSVGTGFLVGSKAFAKRDKTKRRRSAATSLYRGSVTTQSK